jgi:putative endonuclease
MNTKLLGAFGEQSAARFLRQHDYEIFSSNFLISSGEIDIVAFKDNILCFVEVKTRGEGGMFSPAEAVDFRKQENLRSAAAAYINKYKINFDYRFDIVEVIVNNEQKVTSINHIENAF